MPRINLILKRVVTTEVTVELSPEEAALMRDFIRSPTNAPERRGVVDRVNTMVRKHVPEGTTLYDVQSNPQEFR